jgi:acylphosphatase
MEVRWTVFFTGHVQGVGFRFATTQVAREFAVTGQVRNLDDGRVELVAEGSRGEVAGFVDEVARQLAGYIRDRDTREELTKERQFRGFGIG